MNGWIAGGVLVLLVTLMAWLNHDTNDEAEGVRTYCEMVALWNQDAARGVPHADRRGWPPYRGAGVNCD